MSGLPNPYTNIDQLAADAIHAESVLRGQYERLVEDYANLVTAIGLAAGVLDGAEGMLDPFKLRGLTAFVAGGLHYDYARHGDKVDDYRKHLEAPAAERSKAA